MAGILAEGTLYIELVELYTWFEKTNINTTGVTGVSFSIADDALKIHYGDESVRDVDSVDLWVWILNEQLPAGMRGLETLFGVPQVEGPDLKVNFAASSDSDPRGWATPPTCLQEWVAPKEASAR